MVTCFQCSRRTGGNIPPCDADVSSAPGIGCFQCKRKDIPCVVGETLLAPRPDGLTTPLVCDRCSKLSITECSWRERKTQSANNNRCRNCRIVEGFHATCSHGGSHFPQRQQSITPPGHTHLTVTRELPPPDLRPPHQVEAQANPVPGYNPATAGVFHNLSQEQARDLRLPYRPCLLCASLANREDVTLPNMRCNADPEIPLGCLLCTQFGLPCVSNWVALPPNLTHAPALLPNFGHCDNCLQNNLTCDRKRPCDACVLTKHDCTGARQGCFWRGVPGDDHSLYYRTHGLWEGGVFRPPGVMLAAVPPMPQDYHLGFQNLQRPRVYGSNQAKADNLARVPRGILQGPNSNMPSNAPQPLHWPSTNPNESPFPVPGIYEQRREAINLTRDRLIEADGHAGEVQSHQQLSDADLLQIDIVNSDAEAAAFGDGLDIYRNRWRGAQGLVIKHQQQLDLRTIRRRLRIDMLAGIKEPNSLIAHGIRAFLLIRVDARDQPVRQLATIRFNEEGHDDLVYTQPLLNPGGSSLANTTVRPFSRPVSPGPYRAVFDITHPPTVLSLHERKNDPAAQQQGHPAYINLDSVVRPLWNHPNPLGLPTLCTIPLLDPWTRGNRPQVMTCMAIDIYGTVCGRPTNNACEDRTHPDHAPVAICYLCEDRTRNAMLTIMQQVVFTLRAYACGSCSRGPAVEPQTYRHLGSRVWGIDVNEGNIRVAVPNPKYGWQDTGGFAGDLCPGSGCACLQKFFGRCLCNAHRMQHLVNLQLAVRHLDNYVVSVFGRQVCPFCTLDPPASSFFFQGQDGAAGVKKVWACKACNEVVVGRVPDSTMGAIENIIDQLTFGP
ncbi:hypothetical protein GGR54DRAFT_95931 [Hypoxylon sp. NC1633]|nr:hypothetical protein GGR54DRAFT_95931 [Hypoxylon sp. NC1633]